MPSAAGAAATEHGKLGGSSTADICFSRSGGQGAPSGCPHGQRGSCGDKLPPPGLHL